MNGLAIVVLIFLLPVEVGVERSCEPRLAPGYPFSSTSFS